MYAAILASNVQDVEAQQIIALVLHGQEGSATFYLAYHIIDENSYMPKKQAPM